MDDETLKQIFEPFFSTKGNLGTGLGLATAYGIVKQHGGNIRVYSKPGMGTTFTIYLPAAENEPLDSPAAKKIVTELKGTETVLLVEDDRVVRELAENILHLHGYDVLVAEDSASALEILKNREAPVHLMLTDVVMPGMNGSELYNLAVKHHPGLKVLYMSGYPDDVIAHRGVLNKGVQFIQKPFTVRKLAAKIREVLEEEN
jgi:CheY-like chemotaxis protein